LRQALLLQVPVVCLLLAEMLFAGTLIGQARLLTLASVTLLGFACLLRGAFTGGGFLLCLARLDGAMLEGSASGGFSAFRLYALGLLATSTFPRGRGALGGDLLFVFTGTVALRRLARTLLLATRCCLVLRLGFVGLGLAGLLLGGVFIRILLLVLVLLGRGLLLILFGMRAGERLRAGAQRQDGTKGDGDRGALGVEEIHGDLVDTNRRFLSRVPLHVHAT